MPTLYVVSYPNEGHVPYWSLSLARAFRSLGWDPIILSGEKQHGHAYLTGQAEFPVCPARIREMPFPIAKNIFQRFDNRTSMFGSLRNSIDAAISSGKPKPDLVIFPYVDNYLERTAHPISILAAKLQFRYPWAGVLISPREVIKKAGHIDRIFTHNCQGLWVLDETFTTEAVPQWKDLVQWIPDFGVKSSDAPRDTFLISRLTEIRKTKKIISLMGRINKRKGYNTFVKLMNSPKSDGLFFFMGGNLDYNDFTETEKTFIANHNDGKSDKFWWRDIPEEADYDSAFRLSDVIMAAYPNFPNSSNTLGTAAVFGKPVVVSASARLMAARTRDYRLGYVLDETTAENDASLWSFLKSPESYYAKAGAPRFEDFKARFSYEHLLETVAAWLTQRKLPVRLPDSVARAA